MSRADIAWVTGTAIIAVTIAPALKVLGLLPQ